tara:strand:+ start:1020 stop:1286 length:267 start_codon:yes stop_codon:yes gene_type:complete
MKRRSKTHFKAIHISVPIRVLDEFDNKLNYNQSRSAKIALLMKEYASPENNSLALYTVEEIVEHLQYEFHVDSPEYTLVKSLLQILSK